MNLIAILETSSQAMLHKVIGQNGNPDLVRGSEAPEKLAGISIIPIQSYHIYIVNDSPILAGSVYIDFEDFSNESTRIKKASTVITKENCYKLWKSTDWSLGTEGVLKLKLDFIELNKEEILRSMVEHNQYRA